MASPSRSCDLAPNPSYTLQNDRLDVLPTPITSLMNMYLSGLRGPGCSRLHLSNHLLRNTLSWKETWKITAPPSRTLASSPKSSPKLWPKGSRTTSWDSMPAIPLKRPSYSFDSSSPRPVTQYWLLIRSSSSSEVCWLFQTWALTSHWSAQEISATVFRAFCWENMHPAKSGRNLGSIFDQNFTFRSPVSQICRSCFYHIQDLHHIQKRVILLSVKSLAAVLDGGQLDYCIPLIYGLPDRDIRQLQWGHNVWSGLPGNISWPRVWPRVFPFSSLYWLLVDFRDQFKISLMTFEACL